jgi:hypothetical protein
MSVEEVKHHASGSRDLKALFEAGTFSDISLCVRDKRLDLHRNILATSSTYFGRMLDSNFKEAQSESVSIEVPAASSAAAMTAVLEYMYSREITLSGESVMEVLAAADMLGVELLKQTCMRYLEEYLCADNVWIVLNACHHLELPTLREKCMDLILKNPNTEIMFASSTIGHCPKEALLNLLKDDKLAGVGEETVFEAVMAWGEANKGNATASEAIQDFIPLIRFAAMEHSFLHKRVRQSGLLSETALVEILLAKLDESSTGTKRALDQEDGSPMMCTKRR